MAGKGGRLVAAGVLLTLVSVAAVLLFRDTSHEDPVRVGEGPPPDTSDGFDLPAVTKEVADADRATWSAMAVSCS